MSATWPRDKFGVDLTKAYPQAIKSIDGQLVQTPSLQNLPFNLDPSVVALQLVTASPSNIDVGTQYVIVQRNGGGGALATTLNLPATNLRSAAATVFDMSSNFTTHDITVVPDGAETIMGAASFALVSVIQGGFVQLTSGVFVPFPTLSTWGAR